MIANTISEFEPVSILVRNQDMKTARKLLSNQNITIHGVEMNDLWIRDTGAIFVINEQGCKKAVDFNFNGWGNKQEHHLDKLVAQQIANISGVPHQRAKIVMEGGCIEVDGEGTAIITESCVLNDNRNPSMSKRAFEESIKPILGLDKIIWLPGLRGYDITDGHTDFYARFVESGVVIAALDLDPYSPDHKVTKEHLKILKNATDSSGKPLEVYTVEAPQKTSKKF